MNGQNNQQSSMPTTPITGITEKVTGEEMAKRVQERTKLLLIETFADAVIQDPTLIAKMQSLIKEEQTMEQKPELSKGKVLTLLAGQMIGSAVNTVKENFTAERIGRGVGQAVNTTQKLVQEGSKKSKSFFTDLQKGYTEARKA